MALKWAPEALDDVERLILFLDTYGTATANKAARLILEAADQLLEYPALGRPWHDDLREWFVPFGAGAYVLRYRVTHDGDVFIVRVWHSREDRTR